MEVGEGASDFSRREAHTAGRAAVPPHSTAAAYCAGERGAWGDQTFHERQPAVGEAEAARLLGYDLGSAVRCNGVVSFGGWVAGCAARLLVGSVRD